jgi:hypothetical protein
MRSFDGARVAPGRRDLPSGRPFLPPCEGLRRPARGSSFLCQRLETTRLFRLSTSPVAICAQAVRASEFQGLGQVFGEPPGVLGGLSVDVTPAPGVWLSASPRAGSGAAAAQSRDDGRLQTASRCLKTVARRRVRPLSARQKPTASGLKLPGKLRSRDLFRASIIKQFKRIERLPCVVRGLLSSFRDALRQESAHEQNQGDHGDRFFEPSSDRESRRLGR